MRGVAFQKLNYPSDRNYFDPYHSDLPKGGKNQQHIATTQLRELFRRTGKLQTEQLLITVWGFLGYSKQLS